MKLKQILLLFLLFNLIINDRKVINTCGKDEFKFTNQQPSNASDCDDPNEGFCKFVTIAKDGEDPVKFCANIHGDYNDKDVLEEVKNAIKAVNVTVERSNYLSGKNGIIFNIFFCLLLFLF